MVIYGKILEGNEKLNSLVTKFTGYFFEKIRTQRQVFDLIAGDDKREKNVVGVC